MGKPKLSYYNTGPQSKRKQTSEGFFLTKELSHQNIISDGLYLSSEKCDRSEKLYMLGEYIGAQILSLPPLQPHSLLHCCRSAAFPLWAAKATSALARTDAQREQIWRSWCERSRVHRIYVLEGWYHWWAWWRAKGRQVLSQRSGRMQTSDLFCTRIKGSRKILDQSV